MDINYLSIFNKRLPLLYFDSYPKGSLFKIVNLTQLDLNDHTNL